MVNKQKTEYIVLSTTKRLTNTVLKVDNEQIAESINTKYIFVFIDSKLKVDGEVKKIVQKIACGTKVSITLSNVYQRKRKSFCLMQ